jgi:FMN-dependent NADH-azoreductase
MESTEIVMAFLTSDMLIINYEEYKKSKKFVIEPSRRGCYKETDGEQMRMFMKRQQNLDALWKNMGIKSVRTVGNPQKRDK